MTLDAADRAALTDLVHRYAAHIDDRQFDSAAELFAEGAELTLPDPPATLEPTHQHRGRAAIRDALATVAATIRTQHATVGEVYDGDPRTGTAHGRITCVAHHWISHEDQIRDVVWHLRYDDEYRRHATDWRIARRVLTIDAIETRSARQVRVTGPSE
jgi:3-phenylpropionate/cinnamic acid dioxygenase small subunit